MFPRLASGWLMPNPRKLSAASMTTESATPSVAATMIGASSYHGGGADAAFLDGSVRFMKNTIAPPVWWALGTMAGGEIVGGDTY